MKFSELLGEPEPDPEQPETEGDPISVFAPVPAPTPPATASPAPPPPPPPASPPTSALAPPAGPPADPAGFSGLAELNVRQPVPEAPTAPSPIGDQLIGLAEVDDDLLPSGRRHRK